MKISVICVYNKREDFENQLLSSLKEQNINYELIDTTAPAPEQEPERQRYFIAKCREIIKERELEIGRKLTFYDQTFGCQMNFKDSEKLNGILEDIGYVKADTEKADFVYYNTCTVRENANVRVYGRLGALKNYKKKNPEKSLLAKKSKNAGRNNQGKITVRHHGGGNRQKYRMIDFKRNKEGVPAQVIGIEYDPNRTANIALICYADGEKAYILAPQGLTDGMTVQNGAGAEVRVGNCLPLSEIPVGTQVHNIELYPGKGGQLVRSAGNSAQLMAKEGKYATLRLPSGEMRMVPIICRATIGVVGNGDHNLINLGKAGRKRHMGIRPTVRGSVMNPNDHPHGGGEGRAPVGRPSPMTPWGKPAMGLKTRKKKKASNKLIVRRRDGKAIK